MKQWRSVRLSVVIYLVALVVRVVYNITVARNYIPMFDAALYNTLAHNLVDRGCYCLYGLQQSVSRPPLWPFVIALIYTLAGKVLFYVQVFYSFLGAGTCVIVFLFTRDLFGHKAAVFSGTLASVYPCLFVYDGWLYTESLYTFFLTAFVYSLYKLQYTPRLPSYSIQLNRTKRAWLMFLQRRWAIACGILIGLAALTRPNGIFLIGLVVVWGIFVMRAKILAWKIVLRDVLIILCLAVLLVLPWTYRNYQITHTFVPVSTGIGEVLKGVYNDNALKANGQWSPPPHSTSHDFSGYTPANDAQDTSTAFTWIGTHLSALPYLLGLHFLNMWIPYTYSHGLAFEESSVSSQTFLLMVVLIYVTAIFVIASAVFGLICTWKRRRQQLLAVYLLLACIIGQNMIFYGDMRFRAPIEPVLVVLAGGAMWWFMQQRPRPFHGMRDYAQVEQGEEKFAWNIRHLPPP